MPIFANRTLDRLLRTLEPRIGTPEVQRWRGLLANRDDASVSAEWEIVIAAGLAQNGSVEQPPLGRRNPEYVWTSARTREKVVIEVTAVSDRSAHDRNRIQQFHAELDRVATKYGVYDRGGIHAIIGHIEDDSGVTLGIPSAQEMQRFFASTELRRFMQDALARPDKAVKFDFECRGIQSHLIYKPGARSSSGGHRDFRGIGRADKNTIARAVRAKATQIRKASLGLPAILVLCDNDCKALTTQLRSPNEPSALEVVEGVLSGRSTLRAGKSGWQYGRSKGTSQLNGVLIAGVHELRDSSTGTTSRAVTTHYIPNRSKTNHFIQQGTVDSLLEAISVFPRVDRSPRNATLAHRYPAFFGAWTMSDGRHAMTIKISLLTFQRLLSGEISQEQFRQAHGDLWKAIESRSKAGWGITKLEIEHCPEHDDDWAVLKFEAPAPDRLFPKTP